MRVLLLVQNYLPNIQSSARVMHDLAVELRDAGHEVVLAAPDGGLAAPRTITEEEGLTVLRVRSGRFRDVSLARRAFNEWRLSGLLWSRARDFFADHPCSLVVTYSPSVFFGPLVRRLKRLWGARSYVVLRDIFPQWSVDAGVLRAGSLAHRFLRHYELLLYDTADVIGVQSPRNLEYFEEQGLAERYRLEVLYNWAPASGREVPGARFRRELGLEDRVVFFYGGNLGVAQDASALVRLARDLADEPRAFVLVVGSGSEFDRLSGSAAGLGNIRFLPPVDQKTYLGMVSEFDVGLITLSRSLRTHNFPGKLLDYLYCGRPVLAAVNPGNDLVELLDEREAGLVSESGDDAAFLANARSLAHEPDLRRRLGANGRRLLEEVFSPARAARQILACAEAAVGPR